MQVRYIGICTKTDSINGVGLRWEPEQVRNVTAEVAERLLVFSDTWAAVEPVPATDGKIPAASETIPPVEEAIGLTQPDRPVEEPLPVIDFHGMDKKALLEFAETKYNERLDKRQTQETVRHKVIALFGEREMDNG